MQLLTPKEIQSWKEYIHVLKSVYGNEAAPLVNGKAAQLWTAEKGCYCDTEIEAAKEKVEQILDTLGETHLLKALCRNREEALPIAIRVVNGLYNRVLKSLSGERSESPSLPVINLPSHYFTRIDGGAVDAFEAAIYIPEKESVPEETPSAEKVYVPRHTLQSNILGEKKQIRKESQSASGRESLPAKETMINTPKEAGADSTASKLQEKEGRKDLEELKSEKTNAKTKSLREGIVAVKYFMSKGIAVKEFYSDGADSDEGTYKTNLLLPASENRERYKICLIGQLICLDIDRKNGIDGITNFYSYFERIGVTKESLPSYLQDIGGGSYPFYMSTPLGGVHLYFKYLGRCPDGQLCKGVEIKNKQVSAGYKNGKAYILHGNIEDMQRISPLLLDEIKSKLPQKNLEIRHFFKTEKRDWDKPSWEKITEWTDKDEKGTEGRNARAFSLAVHARTHGYSRDETLENLMQDSSVNGLSQKELDGVVKSAYKNRETKG